MSKLVILALGAVVAAGFIGYHVADQPEPEPTAMSAPSAGTIGTHPPIHTRIPARPVPTTTTTVPPSTTTVPVTRVRLDEKCTVTDKGTCVRYMITETFSNGRTDHWIRDCVGSPHAPGDECPAWRTSHYG